MSVCTGYSVLAKNKGAAVWAPSPGDSSKTGPLPIQECENCLDLSDLLIAIWRCSWLWVGGLVGSCQCG